MKYDTDKSDLEKKLSDTNGLFQKQTIMSKVVNQTAKCLTLLVFTNSALNTVENKIPNAISLVKRTDYNAKVNEIEKKVTDQNHDKYVTTPELNTLTAENVAARLAQANLVTNTNFYIKIMSLNNTINSNKAFAC